MTFSVKPRADSPRGWWTILAITLATALAAHLAFDVIDNGLVALWRPLHAVYLAVVVAAVLFAAADIGWMTCASERRRRLAILRARLRRTPRPFAVTTAAALAFCGFTLALEPQGQDPLHFALAVVCAVAALFAGATIFRALGREVLRLIAPIFAARKPAARHFAARTPLHVRRSADRGAYALFRPNRPPPHFA